MYKLLNKNELFIAGLLTMSDLAELVQQATEAANAGDYQRALLTMYKMDTDGIMIVTDCDLWQRIMTLTIRVVELSSTYNVGLYARYIYICDESAQLDNYCTSVEQGQQYWRFRGITRFLARKLLCTQLQIIDTIESMSLPYFMRHALIAHFTMVQRIHALLL